MNELTKQRQKKKKKTLISFENNGSGLIFY